VWCVIIGLGGVSYDCSTDLYAILKEDLTEFHNRDEINKAFVILMCLCTEMPFCARLVFSMITLSAKGI